MIDKVAETDAEKNDIKGKTLAQWYLSEKNKTN